jgi:hypothetical protein
MTPNRAIDDVYEIVKALIAKLDSAGHQRLSEKLRFRMYEVAWTSGAELLKELRNILLDELASENEKLSKPLKDDLKELVQLIENFLGRWAR